MKYNIFNEIIEYDKIKNVNQKKELKKKIKTIFKLNDALFNKIILLDKADKKLLIKNTIIYINDPSKTKELDDILIKTNISSNEYKKLINDYLSNNFDISRFVNIFVVLFIIIFFIKYKYN